MKHLTQWILAFLAIAAVANFAYANLSGAWTSLQEPPKTEKKPEKPPAKKLQNKNRAAKHAALRQALPMLKTSLGEAIGLAEKETSGKAYSAGVEIIEGKPSIQVNLFANDKFTIVDVNPETKKVTVASKKMEDAENGAEGDGPGDDGEKDG